MQWTHQVTIYHPPQMRHYLVYTSQPLKALSDVFVSMPSTNTPFTPNLLGGRLLCDVTAVMTSNHTPHKGKPADLPRRVLASRNFSIGQGSIHFENLYGRHPIDGALLTQNQGLRVTPCCYFSMIILAQLVKDLDYKVVRTMSLSE